MENNINFDITYNRSTRQYDYESVFIPAGLFTYPDIVTLIIRERYSADQMEAIINNYLADQSDNADMTAMQTWRQHAKEVAATFVEKA